MSAVCTMELWKDYTLKEETFAVSQFLAKSAKFYSREIFQNTSSAKVFPHKIFQKSSSAEVYSCRHLQIFWKKSTFAVTVYNSLFSRKNGCLEYKLHVIFCWIFFSFIYGLLKNVTNLDSSPFLFPWNLLKVVHRESLFLQNFS